MKPVGSALPSDKNVRYDRQVRLWGEDSQQNIENARILCIGSSSLASEALKNLVLPGVGHVTVVDHHVITERDLGKNFFVTAEDIGKSRAAFFTTQFMINNTFGNPEIVSKYLRELNPFVDCSFINERIELLLDQQSTFFSNFSLILACLQPPNVLTKLENLLEEKNPHAPLLIAHIHGFNGYLRLQMEEHCIVESKVDHPVPDLRVHNPWNELKQLALETSEESLRNDAKAHAHMPFIYILIQVLEQWRREHDDRSPGTSKEKEQFRNIVKSLKLAEETNFDEAIKYIYTAYSPIHTPSEVKDLFSDSRCKILRPPENCPSKHNFEFWVIVKGLKMFEEKHSILPLRGEVSDFTAETKGYQAVQKCYKDKANRDADEVYRNVQQVLDECGGNGKINITIETVRYYCKNAHFLRLVESKRRESELNRSRRNSDDLLTYLATDEHNVMPVYFLRRACDKFYETYGSYPGENEEQVETDVSKLEQITHSILSDIEIPTDAVPTESIIETCRYGVSEIHSMAAFVGGLMAQEALKLICRKWMPLNNTFLFDGVKSAGLSITL